jgi:hypothetical protein
LLSLANGLRIALNAQPALTSLQANVKPFPYKPEMRVVNTENLWQLSGILKLDLFAQCLGQAALRTSMKSDPR